jgi:hypothetical protein
MGRTDLFLGKGNLEVQNLRRIKQTFNMIFETEYAGAIVGCFIGANALKNSIAIMQRGSQKMRLRISPINHLTIHPNKSIAV